MALNGTWAQQTSASIMEKDDGLDKVSTALQGVIDSQMENQKQLMLANAYAVEGIDFFNEQNKADAIDEKMKANQEQGNANRATQLSDELNQYRQNLDKEQIAKNEQAIAQADAEREVELANKGQTRDNAYRTFSEDVAYRQQQAAKQREVDISKALNGDNPLYLDHLMQQQKSNTPYADAYTANMASDLDLSIRRSNAIENERSKAMRDLTTRIETMQKENLDLKSRQYTGMSFDDANAEINKIIKQAVPNANMEYLRHLIRHPDAIEALRARQKHNPTKEGHDILTLLDTNPNLRSLIETQTILMEEQRLSDEGIVNESDALNMAASIKDDPNPFVRASVRNMTTQQLADHIRNSGWVSQGWDPTKMSLEEFKNKQDKARYEQMGRGNNAVPQDKANPVLASILNNQKLATEDPELYLLAVRNDIQGIEALLARRAAGGSSAQPAGGANIPTTPSIRQTSGSGAGNVSSGGNVGASNANAGATQASSATGANRSVVEELDAAQADTNNAKTKTQRPIDNIDSTTINNIKWQMTRDAQKTDRGLFTQAAFGSNRNLVKQATKRALDTTLNSEAMRGFWQDEPFAVDFDKFPNMKDFILQKVNPHLRTALGIDEDGLYTRNNISDKPNEIYSQDAINSLKYIYENKTELINRLTLYKDDLNEALKKMHPPMSNNYRNEIDKVTNTIDWINTLSNDYQKLYIGNDAQQQQSTQSGNDANASNTNVVAMQKVLDNRLTDLSKKLGTPIQSPNSTDEANSENFRNTLIDRNVASEEANKITVAIHNFPFSDEYSNGNSNIDVKALNKGQQQTIVGTAAIANNAYLSSERSIKVASIKDGKVEYHDFGKPRNVVDAYIRSYFGQIVNYKSANSSKDSTIKFIDDFFNGDLYTQFILKLDEREPPLTKKEIIGELVAIFNDSLSVTEKDNEGNIAKKYFKTVDLKGGKVLSTKEILTAKDTINKDIALPDDESPLGRLGTLLGGIEKAYNLMLDAKKKNKELVTDMDTVVYLGLANPKNIKDHYREIGVMIDGINEKLSGNNNKKQ